MKRNIITLVSVLSSMLLLQGTVSFAESVDTDFKLNDMTEEMLETNHKSNAATAQTNGKWTGEELDIYNPTGPWAPYKFVFEILNAITELMNTNKDIDIREASDRLDLDNPENSKVEIKVGNRESAQVVRDYIVSRGYSEDILKLVVDSSFMPHTQVLVVGFGDINYDGTIDITDLTSLSLALLGDSELTEEQKSAADIDGDGVVTLADLARLQQYLSKKIDSFR